MGRNINWWREGRVRKVIITPTDNYFRQLFLIQYKNLHTECRHRYILFHTHTHTHMQWEREMYVTLLVNDSAYVVIITIFLNCVLLS